MQKGIEDSNSRLKAIIDNAVDGIITIDTKGTIESANPATCRLFGYMQEEMIGQNIKMLMPEPDRSNHDQYIENYQNTGIGKIIGKGREVIGKRKDNSTFPFLLSISVVELSERRIFTGIIHDISELQEVKDALKKEMELNELKSRFVTMASHEFRTPLSAILSSVSLISKYNDPKDDEKRIKHINRIKSSVANLTGILNDFLSLSKLDEGKVLNTPVEFDSAELAREIVEEISPILKTNQVLLYHHYGENSIVTLDKNIIKTICLNLLSNAIKYSSEGKEIEFIVSIHPDYIDLAIKDNGIGIPEADKQHLFNRFFRAQNAGNIEGTGLGLNIVKRYTDLLNGKISFLSELNKGTSFTVTIPYHNN
ncbi:MAG TPA: PAS domain-containing sensor histidine kinase [Cytophagaceae bacterium]|jgi:two-component system sensor kinase FixL|nr:PAS domain-containing sensor histidine kinase [Cytophagaceae bacterium]